MPREVRQRGRPLKQNYINYNYEDAYNIQATNLSESQIERELKSGKLKSIYATKTIYAGNQLEIEIYPEFTRRRMVPEGGLKKVDRKAQQNLNDINARKKLIRLINHNFKKGYWITLTYANKFLPPSMEQASKNIRNYFQRVNYRLKKKGKPRAKYIYITEYIEGEVRCHHHFVIDCDLTMDELKDLWKFGKRNEYRTIDYDENGATGLANYISKKPRGERKWNSSKGNLKDPIVRKDHQTFKRKHARMMLTDFNEIERMVKRQYKGYVYKDAKIFVNEVNAGIYVYVQMRRWDPIKDGGADG